MESLSCQDCANSSMKNITNMIHIARVVITVEGAVALASEIGILLIILFSKAYRTFLQRQFVWIVISLIAMDITRVASIGYRNESPLEDKICEVLGLAFFWSGWCIYIFFSVLLVYLLLMMCLQTRDNSSLVTRLKSSKLSRILLEILIILICLFLPVMFLWVPFMDHNMEYAFNGYMCELRGTTGRNFTTMETNLVYFYGFAPIEMAGLVALVSVFGMFSLRCTLSSKLQHHQHARRVMRNISISYLVVIGFTVAYTLLKILTSKLATSERSLLVVICVSLFLTNLEKIALLIGYLLLFHFSKVCGPLKQLVRRSRGERSCHAQQESKYGTFPESNRSTIPSHTFFSISYTGGFTTISNT